MFSLLIHAFIVLSVIHFGNAQGDGYTCPSSAIEINPPTDINQAVYFPIGWTENQPPVTLKTGQKCQWKVTIPQGLYAQVMFYKETADGKDIYLEYPNMQIESIPNDDHDPYNFASPYVYFLIYQSDVSGAFSFKVQWFQYPSGPHNTVRLIAGDAPIAMKPNGNYTTFQADTQVSLTGFSVKESAHQYLMRRTAVFAGDSTDGEFIGTLYHVLKSSIQVVTVNDKLTVYTFDVDKYIDYTLFMAQDYSNCKEYRRIQGWTCPDTGDCSIEINSVFRPAVMVTSGVTSDFIKGFTYFNENSTLKVYEGMISDKSLITSITKKSSYQQVPVKVNNLLKFYVLDNVRLVMTQTKDPKNAKWSSVSDGRRSVIHSFYYGFPSQFQDVNETFKVLDQEKLFLNLAMTNVDLSGSLSTLSVKVLSDGNEVFSGLYGAKHQDVPATISVKGDTLKVVYSTFGASTTGILINFNAQKNEQITSTTGAATATHSITLDPKPTRDLQTTNQTPTTPASSVETTTKNAPSLSLLSATCFLLFILLV